MCVWLMLEIHPLPTCYLPNLFARYETRDYVDPSKAFTPRVPL